MRPHGLTVFSLACTPASSLYKKIANSALTDPLFPSIFLHNWYNRRQNDYDCWLILGQTALLSFLLRTLYSSTRTNQPLGKDYTHSWDNFTDCSFLSIWNTLKLCRHKSHYQDMFRASAVRWDETRWDMMSLYLPTTGEFAVYTAVAVSRK